MAAHCSGCVFTVCVFTTHCCVCALGWVKCRAPISSMGHHTWQYITLYYTVKIKTWNMIFPKNDKLFYFLLLVNVLFVCAINKDLLSVYYLCIISHNSLRSHHIHLRLKLITQLKPYVFRSSLSIIIHCTPPQTLSPHAWPILHLAEDGTLCWRGSRVQVRVTSLPATINLILSHRAQTKLPVCVFMVRVCKQGGVWAGHWRWPVTFIWHLHRWVSRCHITAAMLHFWARCGHNILFLISDILI